MNKPHILMVFSMVAIVSTSALLCKEQESKGPKKSKKEYSLVQGQIFTVERRANPSTGYVWGMLVNQPPEGRWIELIKSEYIPEKPGQTGGRGKQIFTFKAVRPTGAAKYGIPLYYCRPTSGTISKIHSLIVDISPR